MSLLTIARAVLGDEPPVRFEAYDGTVLGPVDAPARIVVRREDALRHLVRAPGELGLARAYVTGALDVEGDIYAVLDMQRRQPGFHLTGRDLVELVRAVGVSPWRQPPPIPPEEVRTARWGRHSAERDRSAISHHYDVGNDFYRLVLGPSLTYSCAVFESPGDTLEQAQANKHELICRKLDLAPGQRLLDVGCGWGSLVMHAARHHGVEAVGVTISRSQADLARQRVVEAGLGGRVEIRLQDYRDVDDGPFDAISSVGMLEHVGLARLQEYFQRLAAVLRPEGRMLNHQIGRRPRGWAERPSRAAMARRGFINRYVFPDGELQEVHTIVDAMERSGLEVRHLESIREHYALTLRRWVANLEATWDDAVAATSEGRARVWRLYMAGSALGFEAGRIQVHQVLGTATPRVGPQQGRSGMPLRARFEDSSLARTR
jgi:cyclopropane-fatty-acyl-phospholipid synthase